MNDRIASELALLRQHYADVDYLASGAMHWFRVNALKAPPGWSPAEFSAVFAVTEGHPGAEPYGFFVPNELSLNGAPPQTASAQHQPPFQGGWRFLSWQPQGWRATADVKSGSNLWGWVRTFVHRLCEGV